MTPRFCLARSSKRCSVTNELQLLADGKDAEKRARARAGLETVRALERVGYDFVDLADLIGAVAPTNLAKTIVPEAL